MLGLRVGLGILDVWMAGFGREFGRTGAAREVANLRRYDELFCSAVNRDSRSNERNLDWPGVVAGTGALVGHVHKLDLKTQRAATGN
jgi:hypothetical protein